jgi:hypothetical protein
VRTDVRTGLDREDTVMIIISIESAISAAPYRTRAILAPHEYECMEATTERPVVGRGSGRISPDRIG